MASLRGGSVICRWDAAPSVSPVVGEWVGCEWLMRRERAGMGGGAWRLQAADQIPSCVSLENIYKGLVAEFI